MMSGFLFKTSLGSVTILPVASFANDFSLKTSSPPATSISSLTQRMALIMGESHSSK